jgi:uroporphyrinogen-III synthase
MSSPEPVADGVLVTRPEPGASATAARIAALNLRPVIAPMLAVRAVASRLPPPESVQAVLAASANAVAALPPAFHATRLLAVGDATAGRARAAGFAYVRSADGDAEALAALAAACCDPRGAALLLAAGAGRGAPLAAALRGHGFRVLRRVVYAARPVEFMPAAAQTALAARTLRAACFFSAETARAFVRLAAAHPECVREIDAVAIGRPAAVALSGLPWRRIMVARHPTQDDMVALLR